MLKAYTRHLAAFLLLALAAGMAAAFPERPLRLVVPFAAGSAADNNVRLIAEKLGAALGGTVVVDNKPGANGLIGTQEVVRAAADGHTLLYHSTSLVINPWLLKDSPQPLKALAPLVQVASTPYVIAVSASGPVRTLADFIAYARAKPGAMSCSTYGIGSPPHVALELFKQSASLDVLHVPYKGGFAQALPDLVSGQLGCAFDLPANIMPAVRAGRLVAIAATEKSTLASMQGVPVLSAQFPAAGVIGWSGFFVPAATPPQVRARLDGALRRVMVDPAVTGGIETMGMSAVGAGTPGSFARMVETDYVRFGDIIRTRGIQLR